MELTHYSYLFLGIISLNILADIQVEGISFHLGLDDTYINSEVYAEHKCLKDVHQKYNSPCYVAEGVEFLCNHRENLRCSNGTCICFRGYSYNPIGEKCEPNHPEHLVRRKREPGKALPDETCHLSGDCVVGLYCIKEKCKCPDPCKYERDEGICDCGEVNLQFPIAPKVLTVVLTLLSIFIWTFFICKTKNKKTSTLSNTNQNINENGPFEMDPLNQLSKPELVGHDNFHAPPYPPPSYQATMDEGKDCAPSYPISSTNVGDTSAWNVAPNKDNMTLVDTSKSQELPSPYPVSPQNVSTSLPPSTGTPAPASESTQGASLPYPMPQNVSTPLPPFTEVAPTSSDATRPNISEGTSLPGAISPTVLSAPSIGVPPATDHPNTSEGVPLPYSINPLNVSPLPTGTPSAPPSSPPSAPPYTT